MPITAHGCSLCGRIYFERAPACGHCGGPLAAAEISGRGRIYSFTRVHIGPKGMAAPYLLALIELEGDGRVLGRLDPPEGGEPVVGETVRFSGLSAEGPRFRREEPAENAGG